jgi:hypothetical protein
VWGLPLQYQSSIGRYGTKPLVIGLLCQLPGSAGSGQRSLSIRVLPCRRASARNTPTWQVLDSARSAGCGSEGSVALADRGKVER